MIDDDVTYDGSSKLGYMLKNAVRFFVDVGLNVVVIIVLFWFVRGFVFSPFQVSGPSMCDTLNYFNGSCVHGNGEYMIVNKLSYVDIFGWSLSDYERGDIVVFSPPEASDGEYYVKRVIGLPGETVLLKDGDVYVDGEKLEEQYLNESNYGKTYPSTTSLDEFLVPEGSYFVLGDNRRASSDSRRCLGMSDCEHDDAFLPENLIEGKGLVVLWPISKLRMIEDYEY